MCPIVLTFIWIMVFMPVVIKSGGPQAILIWLVTNNAAWYWELAAAYLIIGFIVASYFWMTDVTEWNKWWIQAGWPNPEGLISRVIHADHSMFLFTLIWLPCMVITIYDDIMRKLL